jgi:hypothetical protein
MTVATVAEPTAVVVEMVVAATADWWWPGSLLIFSHGNTSFLGDASAPPGLWSRWRP